MDCLQNSNFPIEEIDRLAKQEKAYLLQNQTNVNYLANTAINAVYFDKHPYSKPLSGNSSFFDSINRDELFEWHQQLLSSNKYVILTGNYNFEECKKIIETQLLKSQNEKIETTASSFEFKNSNKLVIIEKEDNSQCIFRLAAPAPERNNEAHPYFQIANTIFGAMFNSRLNTVIREKEGLTYGINSAVLHRRYASQFIISASLKADKAFFAYKLINDELTKIASSDISEDELYRAKNFIIGSFFRSNESQAQKAQFPANIELYHLDQKYYDKYLKSIENATLEQVHHAAKEYFTNNNFAIAICVSKADEYAEFKECFELVYSDAEGNLRT